MATRAITPKTSVHPEPEPAAPKVKERTKVEVIGPDATPPESNAIPVNKSGENIISNKAIAYPGTKIYFKLNVKKT